MKPRITTKVKKHLKEDIKGYKEEIKEDQELIRDLKKRKGKKMPKKQGYNARLDESMGERNRGKKKQSLKSRRKESEGMEKASGKRKYHGAKTMRGK